VLSKALLLLAVTATAMRSRMDLLMQMGWRATVPVVAASCASLAVSLVFAMTVL
jgi:NADH:ubiquinone oxidoreductase subunit H